MTTHGAPEPTNEQLWAQPPAQYPMPAAAPQANLPAYPAPATPATLPPAITPAAQPGQRDRGLLALAITSLALAIPLTAIAVSEAGLVGLIVVWVGIVCVNAAYASRHR